MVVVVPYWSIFGRVAAASAPCTAADKINNIRRHKTRLDKMTQDKARSEYKIKIVQEKDNTRYQIPGTREDKAR